MGSGRDHYATLFPRQDILDLGVGAPAADDGAAVAQEPAATGAESTAGVGPGGLPNDHISGGFLHSEQHRRECEARYVMKLPLDARRHHYAAVRDKRGDLAMRELLAEVNRQWKMVNEP